MPRTRDRRCRPHGRCRAAVGVSALVAVLLALVVCARPGAMEASDGAVSVSPAAVAAPGHGMPPGCGDGSASDDGGLAPVSPPRGTSPSELLPALYDARGAGGAGCGAEASLAIMPERAPPELVPPSPMDLSILRV